MDPPQRPRGCPTGPPTRGRLPTRVVPPAGACLPAGAALPAVGRASRPRPGLPARARRPPGAGHYRGPALPRRRRMGAGWPARGRSVLRRLRLSHHVATDRRAAERRPDRPRGVLPPPGPAIAAGPGGGSVHDGRRARDLLAQRSRPFPGGSGCLIRLRHQLVVHRPAPVLLHRQRQAIAVPAPVVARTGGTVLPPVALGAAGSPAPPD